MTIRLQTSGWRYRMAYAALARTPLYGVPAKAYWLLRITPTEVRIDVDAIEREIEWRVPQFGRREAIAMTWEEAVRQRSLWLLNLQQAVDRMIANRRVARMDGWRAA